MSTLSSLRRLHSFLLDHLLYPLVLSSLLAFTFYVGRVFISRGLVYEFLLWNLFLAWVPYLCSLAIAFLAQSRPPRWLLIVPLALVWLVFFPNAPYLITDFYHLSERPAVPFWYDLGMFSAFALSGLFLAIASLRSIQMLVRARLGDLASWLVALGTIGLSGLGIYLGRFYQFNSWDLLLAPGEVLSGIAALLLHPIRHIQSVGVSLMFAALLFICYLTFVGVRPAIPNDRRR